jgi:uncharacterized membrane protein YqaE (UPF0057 family)
MNKFKSLLFSVLSLLVVSNVSAQNSFFPKIEKRKYSKGFYIAFPKHKKSIPSMEIAAEAAEITKKDRAESDYTTVSSLDEKKEVTSALLVSDEIVNSNDSFELATEISEKTPLITSRSNTISKVLVKKILHKTEKKRSTSKNGFISSKKQLAVAPNPRNVDDNLFLLVCVILAFLFPALAVLVHTNIDWMKVLIALCLSLLFWVPGIIYALLVIFDII